MWCSCDIIWGWASLWERQYLCSLTFQQTICGFLKLDLNKFWMEGLNWSQQNLVRNNLLWNLLCIVVHITLPKRFHKRVRIAVSIVFFVLQTFSSHTFKSQFQCRNFPSTFTYKSQWFISGISNIHTKFIHRKKSVYIENSF